MTLRKWQLMHLSAFQFSHLPPEFFVPSLAHQK